MPRKPSKPGLWFWYSTRIVDVFSHDKGKHRINTKMSELAAAVNECDSRNRVQESTIQDLRGELEDQEAEIRRLLTALHMEDSVNFRGRTRRNKSTADEVDTVSIPIVSTN